MSTKNKTRINLDTAEFVKGDPLVNVIGKPEEQPAKRHRRLEDNPKIITAKTVKFDIERRLEELQPLVDEYVVLEKMLKVLDSK